MATFLSGLKHCLPILFFFFFMFYPVVYDILHVYSFCCSPSEIESLSSSFLFYFISTYFPLDMKYSVLNI